VIRLKNSDAAADHPVRDAEGWSSLVRDNEDGLSLVEMMVAMVVVAIVLMAMASVAIASMISTQRSEAVVASTQLGNEILEEYLALPFEMLALYDSEAEDHFGVAAEFEDEPLYTIPDPLVRDPRVPVPLRTAVEHQGISFDVETAIVEVDEDATKSGQDYRRVIVLLTWEVRGDTRTARTEAMVTPDPEEQPVTVTIQPDVIRLLPGDAEGDRGKAEEDFTVRVDAIEPQSSVKVTYLNRSGVEQDVALDPQDAYKTIWSKTFSNNSTTRRYANGGTLFEVTAVGQNNDRVSTTMGRVLFLEDLALGEGRLVAEPERVEVDPDGRVCDGFGLVAEVTGAVRSDPLTLRFEGDADVSEDDPDTPPALTFSSGEAITDGARYSLEVTSDDLEDLDVNGQPHVQSGDEELRFFLRMWRSADDAQLGVDGSQGVAVTMPVDEVASCPL
jgi:hypothetical protein